MSLACSRVLAVACMAAILHGCGPGSDRSEDASSLTDVDLTPVQKKALTAEALAGNAEAAFRLSEFYTLAGGDGDPNVIDAHDRAEELRWLSLAAAGGHKVAAFNLAVSMADVDCPRARRMMTQISLDTLDGERARSARYWLEDSRFDCAAKSP
ncbi:MAG TPA: hypothetical protein PLQ03_02425 [Brevundimonas sp.]|uniref:hypothetical protein n=1 Tax=Brevundimonas sp. TaxID=1871086 RepID=UPI002621C2E0|nr:hypothetical protein [Brevundimonas sp.]HRO32248.1 hypothetical protein [Brevundimonas sp.]